MIGVQDARRSPLWNDDNPYVVDRPELNRDADVDVAIVGAGFTGLWTAYFLLKNDPDARVLILDAAHVGYGASGRNGGWCSAISPVSLERLTHEYGATVATAWQHELMQTVQDIGAFADANSIDAHYQRDGWLCIARNAAQERRLKDQIAAWEHTGLEPRDMRWLPSSEVPNVAQASGALFTPHCAAIHPARLVHGLAQVVERLGARIVERTAAIEIHPAGASHQAMVVTARGTVRATTVVRALEGFTPTLERTKRDLVPIYSLMIATEPLPNDVFEHLGWTSRATLNDARNIVIYGQRTHDNRIAFGGRGAPYHFRSTVKPEFDIDDRVHNDLGNALTELWPSLRDVVVTHRWGGPLGITRTWAPFVRHERQTGLASAGGYVGDGVAVSAVAGRVLAQLLTDGSVPAHHEWWANQPQKQWEPEPLRWLGITLGLTLPEMIDEIEHGGGVAPKRSRLLAKLTGH